MIKFKSIKLFRRSKIPYIIVRVLMYILLLDLTFVFLYPFLYMIVTSLKNNIDLYNISIKWIPTELHWQNYSFAFDSLKYVTSFLNSTIVTGFSTIGHILSCSLVAYGLSRYQFKGRGVVFAFVVLTIIVPVQTIIVPQYIVFVKLGWVDSYLPMIIPSFVGFGLKGGLFVFVFRQFFANLPKELEEAARIDGCGATKTFFKIVLPSSKAAILVTGVLSMVWHWNDYFEPNLYITKSSKFMLPQMLPALYNMMIDIQSSASAEMMELKALFTESVIMAGTTLAIVPLFIVYMFLQRQFMEGVERSGIVE